MLTKANRIKKNKEIENVFKNSKNFKEGFLIVRVCLTGEQNSRFGFVVSKKVSKKATVRNQVKRRLRQAIRKKQEDIKSGLDIIITALPGAEKESFKQVGLTLNKIFLKAKILK